MLLHALVLCVALYAVFAVLLRFKRKDLPPGPTPWPFLGNAPDFILSRIQGKSAVKLMTEWKKTYGDVFTIWLGPMPAVNVCDYKTAMDAFVKTADAHSGRFKNVFHEILFGTTRVFCFLMVPFGKNNVVSLFTFLGILVLEGI
ncbi:hypothetical protein L596_029334 [Steinernema carpocapsae]|uniref:Cytochrome P450 n=1 Tax=Steinernema carpocapsae TaxID=34508 RepID=A0A4U5LUC1_STECR|nr:hypothetical protein L596_029334 [Steinernema carpocapsae]